MKSATSAVHETWYCITEHTFKTSTQSDYYKLGFGGECFVMIYKLSLQDNLYTESLVLPIMKYGSTKIVVRQVSFTPRIHVTYSFINIVCSISQATPKRTELEVLNLM